MELIDNNAPKVNPREFNGQFFFTNPDTEDFTAFWNGTGYTFPAMSTSPLVIIDATPIETQQIRKQFAYRLAQRMFGNSKKYKSLLKESEGHLMPKFFDEKTEYAPFIDQCLEPLPVAQPKIGKRTKKDPELNIDPTTGKSAVRVFGEQEQGSKSLVDEALHANI